MGNSRVAFDTPHDTLKVEQQDDYLPFGMEISQGSVANPKNEYLYNKKELQEDAQLYDYGARFYDPVVGRFTTVDPLAEISRPFSPYDYGEDNSIRNIDTDGMETGDSVDQLLTVVGDQFMQESDNRVAQLRLQQQGGGDKGKKTGKKKSNKKENNQPVEKWTLKQWLKAIDVGKMIGDHLIMIYTPGLLDGEIESESTEATEGSLSIDAGNFSNSEIAAGEYLKSLGKDVVLRTPSGTRAAGGTSDLLVNGVNYDVYTPITNNVDNIIGAMAKKNSQTVGIVLDLSKTKVTASQLKNALQRVQGAGAKNIKSIIIMPKR